MRLLANNKKIECRMRRWGKALRATAEDATPRQNRANAAPGAQTGGGRASGRGGGDPWRGKDGDGGSEREGGVNGGNEDAVSIQNQNIFKTKK